jgi:uncharacterized protein YdiU (UPF0061 family)
LVFISVTFGFLCESGVAGAKNFETLVGSFTPLCRREEREGGGGERNEGQHQQQMTRKDLQSIVQEHNADNKRAMDVMWCSKLGVEESDDVVDFHVAPLLTMMEKTEADWTMVWRQLYLIAKRLESEDGGDEFVRLVSSDEMLAMLEDCFYSDVGSWAETTKTDWVRKA